MTWHDMKQDFTYLTKSEAHNWFLMKARAFSVSCFNVPTEYRGQMQLRQSACTVIGFTNRGLSKITIQTG